jgi:AcrR family transcriptional regulator
MTDLANGARKQKVGQESSATRTVILDAAERLMQQEGYAAVTSRRVGAEAGVKPQLVHYYFRTMDELFLAMFRRIAEQGLVQAEQALASANPIEALWAQNSSLAAAAMHIEFVALGNHRKVVRAEIAKFGDRLREIQQAALERFLQARGISPQLPSGVVTFLIAAVGQSLVMEREVGMSHAHAEVEAFIAEQLRRFDAIAGTTDRG